MTGKKQLPTILELRKEGIDETTLINNRRQKAPNTMPSKLQCSVTSLFHDMGCRKKNGILNHIVQIGVKLNFSNLPVQWHHIQNFILFHFWSAIHKFSCFLLLHSILLACHLQKSVSFKYYCPIHIFSAKKDISWPFGWFLPLAY